MAENYKTGIPHEGGEIFTPEPNSDEKEKETPSESSTETTKEEKSPSQEGEVEKTNTPDANQIPFNKRPEYVALRAEEDKRYQKFLAEQEKKIEEKFKTLQQEKATPKQIPPEFAYLFGDNLEAFEKFEVLTNTQKDVWKKELIAEMKAQETQAQEYQKSMDDWVETNISALENYVSDNNLPKFERNELNQVMLKYLPSDENGNLDFSKGYEIWKELNAVKLSGAKEKSTARKVIASSTMSTNKGEKVDRDYKTSSDFKGKSIWQVARGA